MREMKDSGVQWIGEIPRHWNVGRIKYHYNMIAGNGFKDILQGKDKGDLPICKASDISLAGDKLFKASNYLDVQEAINAGFIIIPKGSVLFAKIGEAMRKNNRSLCLIDCCVDNNCQGAVPLDMNSSYSLYLFKCIDMTWFDNAGTVPCISNVKLINSTIPFPKYKDQSRIASFLDSKCAEIDALSADIQKEIETLQEYRKSIITKAVTKGLDPNVEMKDSGVEWIGEIPANWDVHRISNYFSERNVKNNLGLEQNLLSLSYGKIIRKDINSNGGLLPESFNTYNIVEAGDIIIRPTDLQNDKRSLRTGLVCEHGIITSAYIDLAPKNNVISKFYHYQLHAFDIEKVFYNMGNGVRQGLNYNEFAKLLVVEPPVDEQLLIVKFLDTKCSEIDSLISDKQKQLENLAEYRKSLIYEYVTGKKEVPTA